MLNERRALLREAPLKKRTNQKARLAVLLVCFLWGTTWVASKQGVSYMPALQMAGIRQTLGGTMYLLYFLGRKTAWPRGKEWLPILLLSVLNFMLSNALSTAGVKYISAGLGAIIGAIFPLWLVVFGWLGSTAKMSYRRAIGLTVGFSGICLIFYEYLPDFLNPDFRLGIVLSIASTWSWAVATLYTKRQAALFNPYFSLGLQMLIAGPLLYAFTLLTHTAIPLAQVPWQSWRAIIYLAVAGSVVAFAAYLYALQKLPAEQVSVYAYINPVVALFMGAYLFGEKLTWVIAAGVCVTLVGVWLVNRKGNVRGEISDVRTEAEQV